MWALREKTPDTWAKVALQDFETFLLDHASAERKASAVGLSFVVRYPDRKEILEPMIIYAREELEHFHQVYRIILKRNLTLLGDEEDAYVKNLMGYVRTGRQERFLDRLLVSGVMEARGHDRLQLLAEHLTDPELQAFYKRLAGAEAQHKDFFIEMARHYFDEQQITERLNVFLDLEQKTINAMPIRPALH